MGMPPTEHSVKSISININPPNLSCKIILSTFFVSIIYHLSQRLCLTNQLYLVIMLLRISTTTLVLMALSLGASAIALDTNVSKVVASPLEARQISCCALAVDYQWIQEVCQNMYEECGGWSNCLPEGNDNNWCTYCVVKHPEDPVCNSATWPPTKKAPTKRGLDIEEYTLVGDADKPADEM